MKMTLECYNALQKELEQIDETLRTRNDGIVDKDNIEDLGFPYNPTLQEADSKKRMLDARRKEIINLLDNVTIIKSFTENEDTANIHDTVTVIMAYGDEEPYEAVFYLKELLEESSVEREGAQAVSISSPIGKALLGSMVGETKTVKIPAGVLNMTILEIEKQNSRR